MLSSASDDFGNIFLTYLSSDISVKMALSTDGGAPFKPIPFLSQFADGCPGISLEKPGPYWSGGEWRSTFDLRWRR